MEKDRFSVNNTLYIVGMICLVLCLGFLFMSLYILPYLIWELHYHVPDYILTLISYFQDNYNYSSAASKTLVWFIFFIPSLITGLISYFVSNYIDNTIYKNDINSEETQENISSEETRRQIKDSASLSLKIFSLMILIIIVILLLQYFVQSTA